MNYSGIVKCDMANGRGIRTSLFVSGCQFHCDECFNEKEQDYHYGNEYTNETHNKLLALTDNPNISGLSILGGDPLWQCEEGLKELIELCNDIHALNKNVWIWSGFCYEDVFDKTKTDTISTLRRKLISSCDVYVDGRFEKDKKDITLKWRGSSNQRVIDVAKSLNESKVVLYEN